MKRPRILVLDENVVIAQLEQAMFELHDYNVEVTVHIEEALRRLTTRRYDVLVVGSPIAIGGRFLLDIIAELYNSMLSCTIVVTTAFRDPSVIRRCQRVGVYAVVAKPFDVHELSSVVAACVENECQAAPTRWIGIPTALFANDAV